MGPICRNKNRPVPGTLVALEFDPLDSDVIQATIGPHTPVVGQLYVPYAPIGDLSQLDTGALITRENIELQILHCP